MRATTIDAFWSCVEKRGANDCWLWKGRINNGYGEVYWRNLTPSGMSYKAHRIAAWLSGIVSSPRGDSSRYGIHVCHSCDAPLCCNPAHLFAGTHLDNARDSANKGRRSTKVGEINGRAKLSNQQATEIRALRESMSVQDLALKFDVSCVTIRRVLRNACYTGETHPDHEKQVWSKR